MNRPTVTTMLDQLKRRGFTATLGVPGGALQVIQGGKAFKPDELVIREYYRRDASAADR